MKQYDADETPAQSFEAGLGISRRTFIGAALASTAGTLGANTLKDINNKPGIVAGRTEAINLNSPLNVWDLPTPALIIDLDAMEHNLEKMANFYTNGKKLLRPHIKTHKCPILAKRQLELGAAGICAAKVSEAEIMINAGIDNVLITSPIVTKEKIERLIEIRKHSPDVAIVVDQEQNVRDLNEAAAVAGVTLTVLVDLNVGTDRTGITMGPAVTKLADAIMRSPNLKFGGLQAYAGKAQHIHGWESRRHTSRKIMERAIEVRRRLEARGIEVPVLSGGGTGTYDMDIELEGITDLQAGSYIFMDVNYRHVGSRTGTIFDDFKPALFVLATAISQPAPGMITVDAGYKAFATDQEEPELLNINGVTYTWAGDEHGMLHFMEPDRQIKIGEKVLLIASHCDPTVNLYDFYYPMRNNQITEIWPIAARGCSQ